MTSIHEELERIRKPRIHIKYEVETEGTTAEKELPFVVGVMGDFAGNQPGKTLKPLRERNFVTIDRDNFNEVMEQITPGVSLRVPNTLKNDNSEISLQLQFRSLQDFEPSQLVQQIPVLRELKDVRDKLRDLLTKTDRSVELEGLLETILQDSPQLKRLAQELNEKEKS